VGIFLEALQGHGTVGGITEQAFPLIAPVRRDLGIGVQGEPMHAGTVGTRQRGVLTLMAKPRANVPDRLAGPLLKGDVLLHRDRHGTDEFWNLP
jgi:hypothetical protein